jgi:hypothetical protein
MGSIQQVSRAAARERPVKVHVIVSVSCDNCGADAAIRSLDHSPTAEEIKENENEIGGMWCIRSYVSEVETGGATVKAGNPNR